MRWTVLACSLVLAAPVVELPLEAAAQHGARHQGGTRRIGRRAGSRVRRARGRSHALWRRRRFDERYDDPRRCAYVEDGYCYSANELPYDGTPVVSVGASLDLVAGLYPTGPNGLPNERNPAGDLDAGVFPTLAGGFRFWVLYDRLRLGLAIQVGHAWAVGGTVPAGGAYEPGSAVEGGLVNAYSVTGGYQPQLSELVSLYIGARAGLHLLMAGVAWEGRRYDALTRVALTAGPELGVLITEGTVGLMIWGFADLAQPGVAQLSVALHFEGPRPQGAVF